MNQKKTKTLIRTIKNNNQSKKKRMTSKWKTKYKLRIILTNNKTIKFGSI